MKLKLQGRTCFNRHLAPGGNPPTSERYNSHGINEIFGYFTFRTINGTCIGATQGQYLPSKAFIMNKIELVEAAGVGLKRGVENK
jgi:hypothetical protein